MGPIHISIWSLGLSLQESIIPEFGYFGNGDRFMHGNCEELNSLVNTKNEWLKGEKQWFLLKKN